MPVLISTEKQGHRAAVLSIAKRSLDDAEVEQFAMESIKWHLTSLSFESMENETISGEPWIKTADAIANARSHQDGTGQSHVCLLLAITFDEF